jgi:flagellar protein FliO/FliZ
MRGMLEPVLGERGALAAQFLITVVVILALIALGIWLVRRYRGGGLTGIGRARVPRLAIVDAMTIDNRRRLVLVRRDFVEHLILIGGPSDIVVEPSIVRTRAAAASQRPATAPAAGARPAQPTTAAPPPPPSPPPPLPAPPPPPAHRDLHGAEPIPFPPLRTQQQPAPRNTEPVLRRVDPAAAVTPPAPPRRAPNRPTPAAAPSQAEDRDDGRAPPARSGETARATRLEETPPPTELEAERQTASGGEEAPPEAFAAPAPAEAPPAEDFSAPPPDGDKPELLDMRSEPAPQRADEGIPPSPAAPDATATKVSDLEKEMARLLGEISTRRSS